MNTLYISDLDGTLLQPNIQLSTQTLRILNQLIDDGLDFTIATARTIASVKPILQDLHLKHPVILMNGVCVYDFQTDCYLNVETFSPSSSQVLLSMIKDYKMKGFAYTMKDGIMSTYYEELSNKAIKSFHDERVHLYKKPFQKIADFYDLKDEPIIYFTIMDHKENLEHILPYIEATPDLNFVFYKDNYTTDIWYLEIFSQNASKYHGVQILRSYLKPERIVCFGDNRNDLPLFAASDYKIAVQNAVDELKAHADEIAKSNTEDGVALWLEFDRLQKL